MSREDRIAKDTLKIHRERAAETSLAKAGDTRALRMGASASELRDAERASSIGSSSRLARGGVALGSSKSSSASKNPLKKGAQDAYKGLAKFKRGIEREIDQADAGTPAKGIRKLKSLDPKEMARNATDRTGNAVSSASNVRSDKTAAEADDDTVRYAQLSGHAVVNYLASISKKWFAAIAARIATKLPQAACAFCGLLILIGLCSLLFGTSWMFGSQTGGWSDLDETENAVAIYLLGRGLGEENTAAIMGNMYAESSMNPASIEAGSGAGHGLCQWSFGRWNQLEAYASAKGVDWTDVNLQLDYFWTEYCGDDIAKPYATYNWPAFFTHRDFENSKTVPVKTVRFREYFERAGVARDEVRVERADYYYRILRTPMDISGGKDFFGAGYAQRDLVSTAYRTQFAGDGLCATWISNVFSNAGLSVPYGNACDMARASWCNRTDIQNIQVGQVIAVESSPFGEGVYYGHVGIYIGDGKVMHNESSATGNVESNGCTITSLMHWVATYQYNCQARFGWACGVDLSKG